MGQLNTYNPIYCNGTEKVIDRSSNMLDTPQQDKLDNNNNEHPPPPPPPPPTPHPHPLLMTLWSILKK